jgi:hypothetical protein
VKVNILFKDKNVYWIFLGAVINGNRMDLSNSGYKPTKYRTNNTFVLPTSLSNGLSSLNISPYDHHNKINSNQSKTRRKFFLPTPSQVIQTPTYQALEAVYLEHGIRIHLNPATPVSVPQQSNQTAEHLNRRKSVNTIQRYKPFINRNPSRSSSAIHYSTTVQDGHQDFRPFSALQQRSTTNFEETNTHNVSFIQSIQNENQLESTEHSNNNCCSSSIDASEHLDHMILPTQLAIRSDTASATTTLNNNDPDLAYMSALLKTSNGDSFRGK